MTKVEIPEIRYAHTRPVSIDYLVVGDGPIRPPHLTSGASDLECGRDDQPWVSRGEPGAAAGSCSTP